MGFKFLKFKVIKLRRLLSRGNDVSRNKYQPTRNKQPWMRSISHGFCVFEDRSIMMFNNSPDDHYSTESTDLVVAQSNDQTHSNFDVWMFGIFDDQQGEAVTNYLQTNLLDKSFNKREIKRKIKETMKKAHLSISKSKIGQGSNGADVMLRSDGGSSSTSVVVINNEKIVAVNMGDYKTIVCRDGVAYCVGERRHRAARRQLWSLKIISDALSLSQGVKASKRPEPEVYAEKINYRTDFLILASSGIWEVMESQEAVNLINHMDDPQEAADCLAREALTRFSKAKISCLVVRFD